MKVKFVSKQNSGRLILLFSGWAIDWHPFAGLGRPGYDIAVVYDYSRAEVDTAQFYAYREICIVAWSLGVRVAPTVARQLGDRVTLCVAVGGTPTPVDDSTGIPEAVFRGTLDGLSADSLKRFYRRVAGGAEACRRLTDGMDARDTASLAEELRMFSSIQAPYDNDMEWDFAVVCGRDMIFPPANQIRAWRGVPTEIVDSPHFTDFQYIINAYIKDKNKVAERFLRGYASYDGDAAIQRDVVEKIVEILKRHRGISTSESILEVGSGTGLLTRRLIELLPQCKEMTLWDIAGRAPIEDAGIRFVQCDAEEAIKGVGRGSLDLICSASTIQWFNSPRKFLEMSSRALRKGGHILLSTFVKGNMEELEQACGCALPLPDAEGWLGMVPERLEVVELQEYTSRLQFDSVAAVFRHLRRTGVNSLGDGDGAVLLRKALRNYPQTDSGTAQLTYRPMIMLLAAKC